MKIEGTEIIKNQVWKYLMLPILRAYGDDFRKRMNNRYKMLCKIGGLKDTPYLAIVINVNAPDPTTSDEMFLFRRFETFLEWFELQDFCEGHYPLELDNSSKYRYHVIKVKVPDIYLDTVKYFTEGKYSKMYSKEELKEHFEISDSQKKIKSLAFQKDMEHRLRVLQKDPELLPDFIKRVNEKYDTNITIEDFNPNSEVDFPPTSSEDFLIEEEEIKNLIE